MDKDSKEFIEFIYNIDKAQSITATKIKSDNLPEIEENSLIYITYNENKELQLICAESIIQNNLKTQTELEYAQEIDNTLFTNN